MKKCLFTSTKINPFIYVDHRSSPEILINVHFTRPQSWKSLFFRDESPRLGRDKDV